MQRANDCLRKDLKSAQKNSKSLRKAATAKAASLDTSPQEQPGGPGSLRNPTGGSKQVKVLKARPQDGLSSLQFILLTSQHPFVAYSGFTALDSPTFWACYGDALVSGLTSYAYHLAKHGLIKTSQDHSLSCCDGGIQ